MTERIPLLHGAYQARSFIADAQTAINLFPEKNPSDSPVPVTQYPTPGSVLRANAGSLWRCLYTATDGQQYGVSGTGVYRIELNYSLTLIGAISGGSEPVSMCDNGVIMVIVTGQLSPPYGYYFNLSSPVMTNIVDDAFYPSSRVCYLDGYFCFNRVATNQFFLSSPFWDGTDPLDPLDIAAKIGGADPISTIAVIHRELWLIGLLTTEIWYNAGGADFPFERVPGAFVDHGIEAKYSIAQADVALYWLQRDNQGRSIVLRGSEYSAVRISTHAIEQEISSYSTVFDAIGFCYQQDGHLFYILTFPTANKTWVYDIATNEWHQRTYDATNRIRANCCAFANGKTFVGDWQNGNLYTLELDVGTDNGTAITRRRSFPHAVQNGNRVSYNLFQLDLQPGTEQTSTGTEVVVIDWSDDRGHSYGEPIELDMNFNTDEEYLRSFSLRRLGMARDRVFRVTWTFPQKTALQGAWVQADPAET